MVMNKKTIETPNVGEILKEEFLDPLSITPYRLSKEINVSTSTVLDIIHNRRKLTVEMALRLSRFFGNSYKFWLNLQNEIEIREIESKKGNELNKIKAIEQIA
jgi:addiction module HigA family antidote